MLNKLLFGAAMATGLFVASATAYAHGGCKCACTCCPPAVAAAPETAQAATGVRTYSVEPAPARAYYAPQRAYRSPTPSYLLPKSDMRRFSR